jgi:hypothetical protein
LEATSCLQDDPTPCITPCLSTILILSSHLHTSPTCDTWGSPLKVLIHNLGRPYTERCIIWHSRHVKRRVWRDLRDNLYMCVNYYMDKRHFVTELCALRMAKSQIRSVVVGCPKKVTLVVHVVSAGLRLAYVVLISCSTRKLGRYSRQWIMSVSRVDLCFVEFIGAYFFMTGRKHAIKRLRFNGFLRRMGTESGVSGRCPSLPTNKCKWFLAVPYFLIRPSQARSQTTNTVGAAASSASACTYITLCYIVMCIYTFEPGYNVMKGTEYFVSL